MPSKLKKIVDRALVIREKAGFKTETITRKRYNMPFIPDAIKQAAKELKSSTAAPAKKPISPIAKAQAAKAENALNKSVRYNGEVMTFKQMVLKSLSNGANPGTVQVNKIKDLTRRQFNRMDGRQQDEHERRQKEAGKITEYRLNFPDGSFIDITKTQYDFALQSQRPDKNKKARTIKTKQLARRTGQKTKAGVRVAEKGISTTVTAAVRKALKDRLYSDLTFESGMFLYGKTKQANGFKRSKGFSQKEDGIIDLLQDAGYIDLNGSIFKINQSGAAFINLVRLNLKQAKTDKFQQRLF